MRAKVKLNQNLGVVLRYHERKVKKGLAECLYAANMLKEAPDLSLKEKQFFLDRLQSLNERVRRKTQHIFLSWKQEDVLDDPKMRDIAREYMKGMGLGKQPYLVYRHWDALHAHAHVVTTNIRSDGTEICSWPHWFPKSRKLCRHLEAKYGLYSAGNSLSKEEFAQRFPVQKLVYGKTPLKPTMNAVLEMVVSNYRFTTLDEFNAILRIYNMQATQGREDSVTRRNNGLLYFPLKDSGEREGVYIKSSHLRTRPTLPKLQEIFIRNLPDYEGSKQRVTTSIDWVFHKQQMSEEAFYKALQKQRIKVIGHPKDGIYYLDENTRTVYDGKILGQRYSLEGIRAQCIPEEEYQKKKELTLKQSQELRQRPKLSL
jgi:hypothetical protein